MNLQTLAIFGLSAWFFVYIVTEPHPQLLVLLLGWVILIPIFLLRLAHIATILIALMIPALLVSKNFVLAATLARCNAAYFRWMCNLAQSGNRDSPTLRKSLFISQVSLAECLQLADRRDEEVELRKEIVSEAESSGQLCEAANSCDSLAWAYRQKKDVVHERHWSEKAIAYYADVEAGKCQCKKKKKKKHRSHRHNQAALEAQLSIITFKEGATTGAEKHAGRAIALIADCSDDDATVTIARLLNYSYECKNFVLFEEIARRYLRFAASAPEKISKLMQAITMIRLGIIYADQNEKLDETQRLEARTWLETGIGLAEKLDKKDMRDEGRQALEKLVT